MNDIQTSQQLVEHFRSQEAMLRAKITQTEWYMAQMRARPSYYTPCTIRRNGSRWECILASSSDPLECVVAYGDSPEEASANYDHLWWGTGVKLDPPAETDDDDDYEDNSEEFPDLDFS